MPPFQALKRKSDATDNEHGGKRPNLSDSSEQYWTIQWRKPQAKKHKTWEGDGVLVITESLKCVLYNSDGKCMGSAPLNSAAELADGLELPLCGKDIMLDSAISKIEYTSGRCFGQFLMETSSSSETPTTKSKPFKIPSISVLPKHLPSLSTPLNPIDNTQNSDSVDDLVPSTSIKLEDSYWAANWRKIGKNSTKADRPWDDDAFISFTADTGEISMISEEGKLIGSSISKRPLSVGSTLYVGNKKVQVYKQVSAANLPDVEKDECVGAAPEKSERIQQANKVASASAKKFITPASFYGAPPPKFKQSGPLHDPNKEGAIVMKAPSASHLKKHNPKNYPMVPVVIDPIIAHRLRPHQIEGIKFMYECIMGLRKHDGEGCILADEMGLGKTLQTICLVWTLLKQSPYPSPTVKSIIANVLIVCPVSLVNNWKAEFYKWLGKDRVGVVTVSDKDSRKTVRTFVNTRSQNVLIIGYERLITLVDELTACIPPIGLIICDEGHRLKSASNKTTTVFSRLRTRRRIILSGTPMQNDLKEFHAMADFCNPGLLDEYSAFKRVYETPILKSRAPDSTAKERELGEARSAQLASLAKSFVLRREATILGNYLPPKHEYTVFVTPTPIQIAIFSKLLRPDTIDDIVTRSSAAENLALIGLLTKVSNSPILLKATADKNNVQGGSDQSLRKLNIQEASSLMSANATVDDMTLSGKMIFISKLLRDLYLETDEKCVLVSHYTSTLNILEAYCKRKKYSFFRLDGQTPAAKRQEYVNIFNKSSQKSSFVFLLSSKAGGVGINLIGASRLCLVDSDWNPSHDLQSMARCHRDGQKRPVFIYRLLTAGTIDEKIYQRQITKIGLSNSLMGSESSNSKSDSFSRKDLRDIFSINPDTSCNTHDLLECPCDGSGSEIVLPSSSTQEDSGEDSDSERKGFVNASQMKPARIDKEQKAYLEKKKQALASLAEWKHVNCLSTAVIYDLSLHDNVLEELLYRKHGKSARPEKPLSLLEATSLDNIMRMDEVVNVRDVPGGTIAFLFEKSSSTVEKEQSEE